MFSLIKIRSVGLKMIYADRETKGKTDGWTDRHDETTDRFLQICESA